MTQRIVYKNEDETVRVGIPSPEALEEFTIEEIAEMSIEVRQLGLPYIIVNTEEIPNDRTFRKAWIFEENTGVKVDMAKAKQIKMDSIRAERNKAFIDFDKRYTIAQRDGLDLSELNAERQALKDLPDTIIEQVEKAQTPEELKNITVNLNGM